MSYSAYVNCNCRLGKNEICEHQDKKLINEFLSNTIGMSDFKDILELFDGKKFYPLLLKFLPVSNTGCIPVKIMKKFSEQLLLLENEKKMYERTLLVEELSNEVKASSIASNIRKFASTENNHIFYSLDRNGFSIFSKAEKIAGHVVVFRSKNFYQNKISENEYEFEDQNKGIKFISNLKLHPFDEEATESYSFKCTTKIVKVQNEYDYLIRTLKKLALISLQSGNPIYYL